MVPSSKDPEHASLDGAGAGVAGGRTPGRWAAWGKEGERLADAAREAFVSGLSTSLVAGAVVLALGTVGVLLLISKAGMRDLGTGKQGERA